jgi:hypothetical protein
MTAVVVVDNIVVAEISVDSVLSDYGFVVVAWKFDQLLAVVALPVFSVVLVASRTKLDLNLLKLQKQIVFEVTGLKCHLGLKLFS